MHYKTLAQYRSTTFGLHVDMKCRSTAAAGHKQKVNTLILAFQIHKIDS